jgi:hypothetical protein
VFKLPWHADRREFLILTAAAFFRIAFYIFSGYNSRHD